MMSLARSDPRPWWPLMLLAGGLIPLAAAWLWRDAGDPAPLVLQAGRIQALAAMGAGMVGAAASARWRIGIALAVVATLGVHWAARGLGMPPLAHPMSTSLALAATGVCFAGLGAFLARAAPRTALAWALAAWAAEAALGGIIWPLPDLPAALQSLAHLSPARWAVVAIQTALTGTGTRAAASELTALTGLGGLALLATWRWERRRDGRRVRRPDRAWLLPLLLLGWLALAGLTWLRPGPPLPQRDTQIAARTPLPPDAGPIAPIASTAPDAALASALARIERQLDTWPPASGTDPAQRTRNLLIIAAMADIYGTQPLEAHVPLLVEKALKARLPPEKLPALLADIAAYPERGSVSARETLPILGLAAGRGDDAAVRNRMGLYAAKMLARQP